MFRFFRIIYGIAIILISIVICPFMLIASPLREGRLIYSVLLAILFLVSGIGILMRKHFARKIIYLCCVMLCFFIFIDRLYIFILGFPLNRLLLDQNPFTVPLILFVVFSVYFLNLQKIKEQFI